MRNPKKVQKTVHWYWQSIMERICRTGEF